MSFPPRLWAWPWGRNRPRAKRLIDRLSGPLDDILQVLVQESSVGIAIVDRAGKLIRVNESLRRMVDRECDLSPGQPVQDMFCEQRRDEVWDELAPSLQGRRPPRSFISMLRGKSGASEQTVEVSTVALREADETVSGAVLQLTDISAQKRLEAQLAQSQKLQAVGQLAGGIAHDFNNLLTAIIGAADEALARGLPEQDTVEDLEQIRTSAGRGAALVRQLLAFGRQQTLQPRAVSINDAVENLTGLLRRLLGSTIRLELELEHPGRTVRVDPTQLDQVLVNLAVNARDAMTEGGQLTLRTGHITLYRALIRGEETIPPGRYVMVEVQDTGVGIPPEVLPRIFDPFFTTRRERGGSGLGLSTVHGIIRQSDGFLAVDSLLGKGTRIRIYLPRHDGDAMAIPRLPVGDAAAAPVSMVAEVPAIVEPVVHSAPGGRTVLLVDDEDGVRRLAARALTKEGWTVLSAESGEAALALLAEQEEGARPVVILSDVVMPGMDGPSLVRAVREQFPGLPAILASGYAEEAVRGDLAAEDIAFLPKPYTLKVMLAAVRERALPGDLPG
ncbi:PAS domain-containing hybrid sensor histidine kinase/response regulator [Acidisphaera sp. L21]|uniref:hybrid sensor histidine kinase/response regulator n=1 Tax=Acidisphaera sp. L21 TaxID=1641851 RepID=UPI00131AE0C7|nr:PAS domain-containing hybrid sensor histidine kinase/response regulator [Acidisphaera sp. L21]